MNARLKMHRELHQPPSSIGTILVDTGRLRAADLAQVLSYQQEHSVRFGDAAIALNLITPEDVRAALGRQFDHEVVDPGKSSISPELEAAYWPQRDSVESLRVLRSQLMLRWFEAQPRRKCLAVIGAEAKIGRSKLVANLAIVFSHIGQRTLVVDANLRNPAQHRLFGLQDTQGLSGLLSDRPAPNAIQPIPGMSALSVLPAGPTPPNPHELLARPQFSQLLEDLSSSYDVILLDTPSADRFGDAQTIAATAKGALIVCKRHVTSTKQVQRLASACQQSGIPVVGSVLNQG